MVFLEFSDLLHCALQITVKNENRLLSFHMHQINANPNEDAIRASSMDGLEGACQRQVPGSCAGSVGRAWCAAPVVWAVAVPANVIRCHCGMAGGTSGAVGARVARFRVAGRIRAPACWSPSSSSASS